MSILYNMKNRLKVALKKVLNIIRIVKYHFLNNSIGRDVEICKGAYLRDSKIGDYCYLGMYSFFGNVTMGSYCSIAGNVTIGAMEHDYKDLSTSTRLSDKGNDSRSTELGYDVWIGAQCVIRQGVKIGTGAVIGANSFVNKDVPPFAIVFGSPARIYKMRFDEPTINKIIESKYWDLPPKEARQILETLKVV